MTTQENDSKNIFSSEEKERQFEDMRTVMLCDYPNTVAIGKSSVIGKRTSQQDTILTDSEYTYLVSGKAIAILCDGMGGLTGGEKASQLCASTLFQAFHTSETNIPAFFKTIIPQTDADVCLLQDENGAPLNAGTTLVSVAIDGSNLYWASVGDSHAYIIRTGEILCITTEHNFGMLLNERVQRGEITAEEAAGHPKKEALVSYIGMGGVRYVDMNSKPFSLMDGDYIVLCSDGLYRTLEDAEIMSVVCQCGQDVQLAAEKLTETAVGKGKPHQDNTSVVVIQYRSA